MSNFKWSKYLLLSVVILSVKCQVEFFDENGTSTVETGFIAGFVSDMQGTGLADVEIKVKDQTAYSGSDGTFVLGNIPIGDNQTLTFSLPTYATNHKVADVQAKDTVFVRASLGKWGTAVQIPCAQDNTVSFQNATVKLPANGLVDENGQTVSGDVSVHAAWFDPTDSTYAEVFPGDFVGEDLNGNELPIESYGFITVEIKQGDKNLDLAPGETSEITVPIPSSILGNAPANIPLWYFDENRGTWVEEGTAILQNGYYVGTVGHFSSWNCDVGIDASAVIKGKVMCQDGTPIKDARVVAKGVDYTSQSRARTEADGTYEVLVKPSSTIDIFAFTVNSSGLVERISQTIRVISGSIGQSKTVDIYLNCDTSSVGNISRLYDLNTDFPYDWEGGPAYAVGEAGWILSYNFKEDIWERLDSKSTETFYGIDCPAWNSFWVVGSNGTVRFSDDLGANWSSVFLQTDADLLDVEFYNGYYGWIVGTTGKIFRTTDGGKIWTKEESGTAQTLTDAAFVSKDEGWVCGTVDGTYGTILHTTNGGVSWEKQVSNTFENLNGIEFVNAEKGWAIGENGCIVRTENGGQTWYTQESHTQEDLRGIDFMSFEHGIIVGRNNTFLHSKDSGEIWNKEIPSGSPNDIEAVDYRSPEGYGFAVGDDKIIDILDVVWSVSRTNTNGWTKQVSNVSDTIWDVQVIDNKEVWAVGNGGMILKTTDAGTNWEKVLSPITSNLLSIEIKGDSIWLAGSENTLFKSTDGGTTWTDLLTPDPNLKILNVHFFDDLNGQYYADNMVTNRYDLFSTSDGGLSWTKINSLWKFDDIEFIDNNRGWLIESGYTIRETDDGGLSWTKTSFDFDGASSGGSIISLNDELLFASSGGNIYHREIAKPEWYVKYVDFTDIFDYKLELVDFVDAQTGWGIYTFISNKMFKTTDGGKTWYGQLYFDNNDEFTDIDMYDKNIGWAVGYDGAIYYTTTGGD